MKKILFLFLCLLAFTTIGYTQTKGDLIVGTYSQLTGRVVDFSFNPSIGYQLSDNVQLGASISVNSTTTGPTYDWYQLYGKYYPTTNVFKTVKPFAQLGIGISLSDSYNVTNVNVGVTKFLRQDGVLYIEPSVGFAHSDFGGGNRTNSLGVRIGIGLRL